MNYIVSGLERSGTSLMMQILDKAGFPVWYDDTREADEHNPKGYYELYGGKIINYLSEIDMEDYKDKAIKVTSYGLEHLPEGDYKIIYMIRPLEEVYESQTKMMNNKSLNKNKEQTLELLDKMNMSAMSEISRRMDMKLIYIRHDLLMSNPKMELERLSEFLDFDVMPGISVIDKKLWRNRK